MIDSKQLRIGNLVSLAHESNNPIAEIIDIRLTGAMVAPAGEFGNRFSTWDLLLPIELTTDWLVKFGFEAGFWDDMGGFMKTFGGRVTFFLVEKLYTDGTSDFLSFIETNVGMGINSICLNPPRNVHSLQNLVYSLTGEELTIKTN